jgi:hypothetical protein
MIGEALKETAEPKITGRLRFIRKHAPVKDNEP